MSHLSDRPADAVVGHSMPHESAALHVTGVALYTDDLVNRHAGVLHAYPVQAPHAHAPDHRAATPAPALRRAGRGARAHRRRRARRQRRRASSTTSRSSRTRSCSTATRSAGCSARRWRPRGSARRRSRSTYEPLPSLVTVTRGDRGRELPGRAAAPCAAATPRPRFAGCGARLRGRVRVRRPGALLPRDALRRSRRSTRAARCSCSPAPSTRPRRRRSSRTCWACRSHEVTVQCLRMGGGVRRQGDAAARLRRDRRARRHAHRPPGAAAAQPHAGHDDDRQAARLPRAVEGRLRRRRP